MNISSNDLYQYWQNQILNQLGIVRWVEFNCQIIELDINDLEKSLNFPSDSIPKITDDIYLTNRQQDLSDIDEPIYLDSLDSNTTFDSLDPAETNISTESIQNTAIVIDKFHLQMLVFQDWIILADLAVLRENSQQQLLWQNLSTQLHSTPDDFVFPIIIQNTPYDLNHTNQPMCTDLLALALFEGKICALNQDKIHQIGCVTALPDIFNKKQIYSLPTLQTMLNDSQQKRLFWHTLKGVH